MSEHNDLSLLRRENEGLHPHQILQEFFQNPEYGTPENISPAGCIELARRSNEIGGEMNGHIIWNAWRDQFPVSIDKNNVNFEGHEFSEGANFLNYNFGERANFRKTIFRQKANFVGASFGNSSDFSFSYWEREAWFQFSRWDSDIRFGYAYWRNHAEFMGSQWGSASFHSVIADGGLGFRGASWADSVDFSCSTFKGWIDLEAATWNWLANHNYYSYGTCAYQNAKSHAEGWGCDPTIFPHINCSGALFEREVNFSNRKFTRSARFGNYEQSSITNIKRDMNGLPIYDEKGNPRTKQSDTVNGQPTSFQTPPIFHGCELHQDTSFAGAIFPPATGNDSAARAYRTLKLAFGKQQAIREEQRFFHLEMDEEAQRESGLRGWLFKAYKIFSDYGFSVKIPMSYLGYSIIMFTLMYGLLSWVGNCVEGIGGCSFKPQWLEFSLLQALPIPGLDRLSSDASKEFWPQGDWWVLWLLFLVILQKIIGFSTLFLAGLGLRNLFKLR